MIRYKVIFDGLLQKEIFDTYENAENYINFLQRCSRKGAEMENFSMDKYEDPEYEIIEYSLKLREKFIMRLKNIIPAWSCTKHR